MRFGQIRFRNILGYKEFELDFSGDITIAAGGNATGKTSLLNGIKTLIDGGNLAKLKNVNAPDDEPAEAVLVLNGDDGDIIVRKRDKKLSVKKQIGDSAAYDEVKPAQRFLDTLFSSISANPVTFITADDRGRVEMLLRVLPVDFDREILWKTMKLDPTTFAAVPQLPNPLSEIAETRKVIFKRRTDVNRDEKSHRATCQKIRETIPAEIPTVEDTDGKWRELSEQKSEIARRKQEANDKCSADRKWNRENVEHNERFWRQKINQYEAELRAEMVEKLAAKRTEADNAMLECRADADTGTTAADARLAGALAEISETEAGISDIAGELAMLRERADDAIRIKTLSDQSDDHDTDAEECLSLSKRLTGAIVELDAYKAGLLENLPISGLDIVDGVMTVDGVTWKQVNTARQMEIAVAVACLLFADDADFRPVFIDGAEALDSKSLELLCKTLDDYKANALVARVEDHDFETRTWDGASNE